MTKLYFNVSNKIAILINEDKKTYKVIKGDLNIKSLFKYQVNLFRLKEIYNNVRKNYSMA